MFFIHVDTNNNVHVDNSYTHALFIKLVFTVFIKSEYIRDI